MYACADFSPHLHSKLFRNGVVVMAKRKTVTDMTVGTPLKHILMFALPLLVGNLFQQFYNMVDSLIVGNYVGANALAAVGNCSSMNNFFFALANGLSIGIGILVAQYFGAQDEKKIRAAIANAIYVLGGVGLVTSILGMALSGVVMRLLGTPDLIYADSVTYMRTTCAGMVAVAFYNGVAAILRALGDSKTPLYFLILSSIVNVVLDLTFVLAFQWGVFGVAFATIIAQAVSAIVCMVYAYLRVPYFKLKREELKPQKELVKKSFTLGVPIALQSAMICLSCIVLQGIINSFGETVMAVATIITRIEQLVQQPFSSLAAALTSYTGQNIGARKTDRVKKGYRQSAMVAIAFGALMIPISYLFGEQIVGVFVKDAAVIAMGAKALRINSTFYIVLGLIHVSRAVLNGSGDTGFALLNGLTEVVCRIGYANILTRIPAIGYWGIWITTGFTWATTALVCVLRYLSGVWKKKAQ